MGQVHGGCFTKRTCGHHHTRNSWPWAWLAVKNLDTKPMCIFLAPCASAVLLWGCDAVYPAPEDALGSKWAPTSIKSGLTLCSSTPSFSCVHAVGTTAKHSHTDQHKGSENLQERGPVQRRGKEAMTTVCNQ